MNLTTGPRIRKSPYFEGTVRDGATDWTVYNKMLLPLSFGDLRAEYDRLIDGVAMWDVAGQRQVEISGRDADALAQYLSARDLSSMVEGQGKYVAMCDHGGRLLNDPVLLKLSGGRYWFSLADHDMLLWCRAVAAERGFDADVEEPDVSPLAVQGPRAANVVADLFGEWIRELRRFWFEETKLDGIPVVVCRSGWSKQGGYELFLQDAARGDELWERVKAAGKPHGIGPGAPNQVERVESGLLSFGGDTTPGSNPFEAGMARFVDTDTAVDYIGKAALREVVARGPDRLLVGLVLEGAAPPDWPLDERVPIRVGGRPVGTMSAVVHSPRLDKTIALAQLDSAIVSEKATVEVDSPQGSVRAAIRELPFL